MGRERVRCEHCGSYFDFHEYLKDDDRKYCFSCRKALKFLQQYGIDCDDCWDRASQSMKEAAKGGARSIPFCDKHSPIIKNAAKP